MLFEDSLNGAIKDYVLGLLPENEMSSGLVVEVFTLCCRWVPGVGYGRVISVLDVDKYWLATLTDRYFRLHQLDNWWEPSHEGYSYYEKTWMDGRFRPSLNFDSVMDTYGKRLCYLPVEINRHEVIRCSIDSVALTLREANSRVQFHIKDNHMLHCDDYLEAQVSFGAESLVFNSIYLGSLNLVDALQGHS